MANKLVIYSLIRTSVVDASKEVVLETHVFKGLIDLNAL